VETKTTITIRIGVLMHRRLDRLARQEGVTISEIVRRLLESALEKEVAK